MMEMLMSSPSEEMCLTDLVTMLSEQETNTNSPLDNRRAMITEVVHVPTSEHVAQIVGKAGSKIKALRAKTNTCIKTPLRGDQPFFTITGNVDDVRLAQLAIQHASQHFTNLMTSRSNCCAPGEVTIQVPVPQQYVGVVVGRGGTVIMRIKEQTNTRINTPKDDSNATAFEVTGSKVNVLAAKEAIEEKVRQAYQLRNSSVFDPNLSKHKLIAQNQMPVQKTFHPFTQIRSPIPFGAYNMPIGPQSAVISHKSDKSKSLLVKAENNAINNNRNDTESDNQMGNTLYESFYRLNNTVNTTYSYSALPSVWNY